MALRMRLYSCTKHRRNFIFAESTVPFTALNLRAGEADIPFALVSKVGHESVVDSVSIFFLIIMYSKTYPYHIR